ncbi:hypothetical protein [Kribbella monticola]|uniref:hypothetical protein n=1 Tax=Kribbella monticola TaxID=2185285 RepID=UPI000DD4760B|nr:hypothetical protein [Kribbella monticola]
MILEDIASLPVETAVVVEGAFVTPTMAGVTENAVWLMPSKTEQLTRLEHRNPGGAHDGQIWGWNLIHNQLEGTTATIINVDHQTIEQTLTAVEQRFNGLLKSAFSARTAEERQSLIRIGNHQLAIQATERQKSDGRQTILQLDCECAQPNCTNFVELPIERLQSLLANTPPSIVSPDHRSPGRDG